MKYAAKRIATAMFGALFLGGVAQAQERVFKVATYGPQYGTETLLFFAKQRGYLPANVELVELFGLPKHKAKLLAGEIDASNHVGGAFACGLDQGGLVDEPWCTVAGLYTHRPELTVVVNKKAWMEKRGESMPNLSKDGSVDFSGMTGMVWYCEADLFPTNAPRLVSHMVNGKLTVTCDPSQLTDEQREKGTYVVLTGSGQYTSVRAKAAVDGDVDFASTAFPYYASLYRNDEVHVVARPGDWPLYPGAGLVVRQDNLDAPEFRKFACGLMNAHRRAFVDAVENPEAYQAFLKAATENLTDEDIALLYKHQLQIASPTGTLSAGAMQTWREYYLNGNGSLGDWRNSERKNFYDFSATEPGCS